MSASGRMGLFMGWVCAGIVAGRLASAQIVIDDFEQNNGNINTLGHWSAFWVAAGTSAGDLIADQPGAQKNGANGGILYYSNGVSETARCTFYSVLNDVAPFPDLSAEAWHLRFWLRSSDGTPAIDAVRLEGEDGLTQYGEVDFAAFNGGTDTVAPDWREISIPATSFLAQAAGGFTLATVKVVSIAFSSTSSVGRFSSVFLDDLQLATNPAPFQGLVLTNTLTVDDFEQGNDKPNSLGLWADTYADTNTSAAGFIPDSGGAQKNGASGGVLYYSNSLAEASPCLFYTVLRQDWPYLSLTSRAFHVRFWIRGQEGTPAIEHVVLEGASPSDYGRVAFADYNGGTGAVPPNWREISIPAADFLGDAAGGFSLDRVKVLSLTFAAGSSTGAYSAVFVDDIRIATNAAPPPPDGTPVTSSLMIDDFEQANSNPNSLGYWSDVYVGSELSLGGIVPDLIGNEKNGLRGGVLYYRNGAPETSPCKFYSVLSTNSPYLDLNATSLYVRFWIKAHEGTPAIERVFLEGSDYTVYGRVDFGAYNGGPHHVGASWREISIPVADFLSDAAPEFRLESVALLAFTFVSNSSVGYTSAVLVDDIQLATEPATEPLHDVDVAWWLIVDDFEQGNDKPNSLGLWSDVYYDPAQSSAGFIPDYAFVPHDGAAGGVVFYSNSPSATVPCFFYSLVCTNWPYGDLSDPQHAVSFWIRAGEGAPVIDQIVLEGESYAVYAQVSFSDYNGGSAAAPSGWRLVSAPLPDFLADSAGGFTLDRVKLVGLRFAPTSSVGRFSSVWIDSVRIGKSDVDADGIPDYWEQAHWGGDTNATATADDDEDGVSNFDEFVADTNPGDSNSVFVIDRVAFHSPPSVVFETSSNRLYDVQYASNLVHAVWLDLRTSVAGNGGLLQVEDPDETVDYRAYRVKAKLP